MGSIKNVLLSVSFFTVFACVQAVEIAIQEPGLYTIGGNISITPAVADVIISVNASGVVLDLNDQILNQTGGAGAADGIAVAANLTDVTIKNGTVQNIGGTGITVANGCQRIAIQDLSLINCAQGGIFCAGAGPNPIQYLTIQNCRLYGCAAVSSFGVIRMNNCRQSALIGCSVEASPSGGTMIGLSVCDVILIEQCKVQANFLIDAGFAFDTLTNSRVIDCSVINNSGNTNFIGFDFAPTVGASINNQLINAVVKDNTAPSVFTGINIERLNSINGCEVQANSGTSTFFGIASQQIGTTNATFKNCTVTLNAGGSPCAAFLFSGSNGLMENCIGSYNTTGAGQAIGLFFNGGALNNFWTVRDSNFVNNTGNSPANSIGILVGAGDPRIQFINVTNFRINSSYSFR